MCTIAFSPHSLQTAPSQRLLLPRLAKAVYLFQLSTTNLFSVITHSCSTVCNNSPPSTCRQHLPHLAWLQNHGWTYVGQQRNEKDKQKDTRTKSWDQEAMLSALKSEAPKMLTALTGRKVDIFWSYRQLWLSTILYRTVDSH